MAGIAVVRVGHDVEVRAHGLARRNKSFGIPGHAGFPRQPLRWPADFDLHGAVAVLLDGFGYFAHGLGASFLDDINEIKRAVIAIDPVADRVAEELVNRLSAELANQVEQAVLEPVILRR